MKSVWVHGSVALLALGWALMTWIRPPEDAPLAGESTVVACTLAGIESLHMEHPRGSVNAGRRGDDYWIALETHPAQEPTSQPSQEPTSQPSGGALNAGKDEAAKANSQAVAEPTSQPTEQPTSQPAAPKTERFVANDSFHERLAWLAPLRALRDLGTLDTEHSADFGLDEVDTFLTYVCNGQEHKMEFGGSTYGGQNRYARLVGRPGVLLVQGNFLRDLRNAQYRFMRKKLHSFEMKEVSTVVVTIGEASREYTQHNAQDPAKAMWASKEEPDTRDQLFENWSRRVAGLMAQEYLDEGTAPATLGSVEEVVQIQYRGEGDVQGHVEVVRIAGEEPLKERFFGRSERTGGWVQLVHTVAAQVARDARSIVGLEESAESKGSDKDGSAPKP